MRDLDLLAIELETCAVIITPQRFLRTNSPDAPAGPKVAVFGCAEGAHAAVRADVDDAVAERVLEHIARAPAHLALDRPPEWMAGVAALLEVDSDDMGGGPAFLLPHGLAFPHPTRMVAGESDEGAAMLERFARDGMPPALVEAGYVDVGELWAPWCAALAGDDIAALCCSARLGQRGAEAGLYTFAPFRGQGCGAAVTAAWSTLPSLARRTLFYSTAWSNRASIAVTRRLGLRQIGWSASVG